VKAMRVLQEPSTFGWKPKKGTQRIQVRGFMLGLKMLQEEVVKGWGVFEAEKGMIVYDTGFRQLPPNIQYRR
jgi:hypothetical protein